MSFLAHTGLGGDNTQPRAVARLSTEMIIWLCHLLCAAEAIGVWPLIWQLVLIVLIPKPDGGRRPIGLFPTITRIWMRARRDVALAWESKWQIPSLHGGAAMGAQRAAWQSAFRAEAAANDTLFFGQSLLDLIKAFQRLPHHLIAAAARRLGYSLYLLRLSIAAYRLPRALGIDGAYSRRMAALDITAGAGFATTELRILLYEVVTSTLWAWSLITLFLYFDDATLEIASSSQRVSQLVLAGATNHFVTLLEDGLQLEVSTVKSGCVASSHALAKDISKATRKQVAQPWRHAKLLGVGSAGGRRRCTKVIKMRVKQFKKRIPRIRRLRTTGVNTIMLTRTAGTPMITYGADVSGLSNSHLEQARRAIAKAITPEAGGKNYEVVLHIADAQGGTVDPAFDAHVLPFMMWSLALSQRWQTASALAGASRDAYHRVIGDGQAVWRAVNGSAAALVASALRIGWSITDGRHVRTDDEEDIDMLLDPTIVIVQAVRRAVRRWRLQRVHALFPSLVPARPHIELSIGDGQHLHAPMLEVVLDFSDVVGNLLSHRVSKCKTFDDWEPKYKADLRSAATGGQWPQARVASVRAWAQDSDCQLCHAATGTLAHRLLCPAIKPHGGWPGAPLECNKVVQLLGHDRHEILKTRGLFAMKVRVPGRPQGGTFSWIWPMPLQPPDDLIWLIDGSLFDESRRFARRTGFGIAMVTPQGSLVAFGLGVPPLWVIDASGAELWAYFQVLCLTLFSPTVVTDCLGILDALKAGVAAAMGPKKSLARTWAMVAHSLDGDFALAASLVTWMPSHESAQAIGRARDSNGRPISALMWRANRLVDVLAKKAAAAQRLPRWVTRTVEYGARLTQHHAARLPPTLPTITSLLRCLTAGPPRR